MLTFCVVWVQLCTICYRVATVWRCKYHFQQFRRQPWWRLARFSPTPKCAWEFSRKFLGCALARVLPNSADWKLIRKHATCGKLFLHYIANDICFTARSSSVRNDSSFKVYYRFKNLSSLKILKRILYPVQCSIQAKFSDQS